MATIDDVYGYLQGPIVTELDIIRDSVNPTPWIGASGVAYIAQHVLDLCDILYDQVTSPDPGKMGQNIKDLRAAVIKTLHGPD